MPIVKLLELEKIIKNTYKKASVFQNNLNLLTDFPVCFKNHDLKFCADVKLMKFKWL